MHHIVFVTPSDAARRRSPMSVDLAGAIAARILDDPGAHVDVEMRGADPLDDEAAVRRIAGLLRDGCARAGRTLGLSIATNLRAMTQAACEWLVVTDFTVTLAFDGPPEAHEANRAVTGAAPHETVRAWIRQLHELYARRSIGPAAAYVNGVTTVTRATLAAAPDGVVEACVRAGLVYVQMHPLRSPRPGELACSAAEFDAFYGAALDRILDLNEAGTLLVEKRLALHLETLSSVDPRRPSTPTCNVLTYGPDGHVYAREDGPALADEMGGASHAIGHVEREAHADLVMRALEASRRAPKPPGCAACAYDPYCGGALARRYLVDPADKTASSAWCDTSMTTFGQVFGRLRSDGARVRRVNRIWQSARDQVEARFRRGA
jgi:sulfatase maturation enzyme AslB (radical SAM superfamily)